MSYVIDASVFNKMFLNEPDKDLARDLIKGLVKADKTMLAPSLLRLEIMKTALHFGIAFSDIQALLKAHVDAGLVLIDPADDVWTTAERIATSGNAKAGYPALEDSLYHALAIHADGTFVTADQRHVAKAKSFGHVALLSPDLLKSTFG